MKVVEKMSKKKKVIIIIILIIILVAGGLVAYRIINPSQAKVKETKKLDKIKQKEGPRRESRKKRKSLERQTCDRQFFFLHICSA